MSLVCKPTLVNICFLLLTTKGQDLLSEADHLFRPNPQSLMTNAERRTLKQPVTPRLPSTEATEQKPLPRKKQMRRPPQNSHRHLIEEEAKFEPSPQITIENPTLEEVPRIEQMPLSIAETRRVAVIHEILIF